MIEIICDKCGKESTSWNDYEYNTRLQIGTDSSKRLFTGHLCDDCQEKFIKEVIQIVNKYDLREDESVR